MLPSSAIRIIENTPSKLVIFDPPYYVFGVPLVVLSILLIFSPYLFRAGGNRASMSRWLILLSLPLLLPAIASLGSWTTITMDGTGHEVVVQRTSWIFHKKEERFPFSSIVQSTVGTGRGTHNILLILRSGNEVPLTRLTTKDGPYAGSAAINEFLRIHMNR